VCFISVESLPLRLAFMCNVGRNLLDLTPRYDTECKTRNTHHASRFTPQSNFIYNDTMSTYSRSVNLWG